MPENPLLDDNTVVQRIMEAVETGTALSMIRLGDGEAVVLSFPDSLWLEDLTYLQRHWGATGVRLGDVAAVKQDLEAAVRGADLVGVRPDVMNVETPDDLLDRPPAEIGRIVRSTFPLRPQEAEALKNHGARRLALMNRVLSRITWTSDQALCSAWIHWELLAMGALARLLETVDHVGLVTSRPQLNDLVARRFNVATSTVLVPDKHVDGGRPGAHVPTRYREIRAELNFSPSSVVLVGAGIVGKAYCNWLKESGCIALDVGSVFDAWIGRTSRPMVLQSRFGVPGGDHVPDELRLGSHRTSTPRRLIPRWKPDALTRAEDHR